MKRRRRRERAPCAVCGVPIGVVGPPPEGEQARRIARHHRLIRRGAQMYLEWCPGQVERLDPATG